jgi:hypothetical protein
MQGLLLYQGGLGDHEKMVRPINFEPNKHFGISLQILAQVQRYDTEKPKEVF